MSNAPPSQTFHQRTFPSLNEIRQHIAKLDERLDQVQELMQEGVPYLDAQKVKVEHGIKETIRDIFGEGSSEFHQHRDHTIDLASHTSIAQTVAMLKGLISQLEIHKAALLSKTRPPGKPASRAPAGQPAAAAASAARPPPPPTQPATARPVPQIPKRPSSQAEGPSPSRSTGTLRTSKRAAPPDALRIIRKTCARFHGVVRQLRERSEDRVPFEVEDEHDVRDLLRALLHLEFDDVLMEEWTPDPMSAVKQRDCLIESEGVVIAAFRASRSLGPKEIAELWTATCDRYGPSPDCQVLFGFVYDPEGRIGTPRRLEADLMAKGPVGKVEVHILPQ